MHLKLLSKALIYLTVPLICWHSLADTCKESDARATQNQVLIPAYESGHKVIGKGRAYIYSAPTEACHNDKLFLIPNDLLNAYAEYEGFVYILYIHPNTSKETTGWMKMDRLQQTGSGLSPKPQ